MKRPGSKSEAGSFAECGYDNLPFLLVSLWTNEEDTEVQVRDRLREFTLGISKLQKNTNYMEGRIP